MAILDEYSIKKIIEEIQDQGEVTRRSLAKRRHDVYKDGGKRYLLEELSREFTAESISELRLDTTNILKKIINKRSSLYSQRGPIRTANNPSNQMLLDYYVEELEFNQLMAKANKYFNLFSNTVIYVYPKGNELQAMVLPSYLYSGVPDTYDRCDARAWVLNSFTEDGTITLYDDVPANGPEGFSRQVPFKTTGDLVNSNERTDASTPRQYIFWTDEEHFTCDQNGNKIVFDPSLGNEQFLNPINKMPLISLNKDRDSEFWAEQGEDLIDGAIQLQKMLSDVATIAKMQGFSLLCVTGPEQPASLKISLNKAVFLKSVEGQPTPTISYVQASSQIDQYMAMIMEKLGLLLTTNDMNPKEIGGSLSPRTFSSGFQALIEQADTLMAISADKPVLIDAEKDTWEVIALWHNFMYDSGNLEPEAQALGKFSDDFSVSIVFREMKPMVSEQEILQAIQTKTNLGLITRRDALKQLNPDLTEEEIDQKLAQIDAESAGRLQQFAPQLAQNNPNPNEEPLSKSEG
jgi:hypothetical protein